MQEKDPEMFTRLEQEQRSGNLERMQRDYIAKTQSEITRKNQEYNIKPTQPMYTQPTTQSRTERSRPEHQVPSSNRPVVHQAPTETHIVKKNKGDTQDSKQPPRIKESKAEEKQSTSEEKAKAPVTKSVTPHESQNDQTPERYERAPVRPNVPQRAVEREKSDVQHKYKR
jgi:hypothetical protein